jgi:hypothetical protein
MGYSGCLRDNSDGEKIGVCACRVAVIGTLTPIPLLTAVIFDSGNEH